jgi:polyhydroxyalkanoate synthesis regulator phasin
MANKDAFQKYLDAGIAFTNMTRARAEELVAELVKNGEFQGKDARAKVDELLEKSRKSREALMGQVRHEVTRQLETIGITSVDDLAKQVADLLGRTAAAGRAATAKKAAAPKKSAAKKSTAKKTAAKKSPAKKASATKAAAKKSPAKKAAASKAGAKKSTATKAAAPRATGAGSGSNG